MRLGPHTAPHSLSMLSSRPLTSCGAVRGVWPQPRAGSVLLFTQDLLHEGSLVERGESDGRPATSVHHPQSPLLPTLHHDPRVIARLYRRSHNPTFPFIIFTCITSIAPFWCNRTVMQCNPPSATSATSITSAVGHLEPSLTHGVCPVVTIDCSLHRCSALSSAGLI